MMYVDFLDDLLEMNDLEVIPGEYFKPHCHTVDSEEHYLAQTKLIKLKMKQYLRTILLGLMIWTIPFVAGFLFYNQEGELSVDIFLFKTVMLIVGALGGAWAIILFFRKVNQSYLKESIVAGLIWFTVNILLDMIILLPINGMSMGEYFVQIGLRYLSIPITVILCGYLLDKNLTGR